MTSSPTQLAVTEPMGVKRVVGVGVGTGVDRGAVVAVGGVSEAMVGVMVKLTVGLGVAVGRPVSVGLGVPVGCGVLVDQGVAVGTTRLVLDGGS